MCDLTRRGFLAGCSAAIAALAGSRCNTVAFGDPGGNDEILINIFLRGGMDGLHLVMPIGGPDRSWYEGFRPQLRVPVAGPGSALALSGNFGLHPSAAPLLDLYQDGRVALIHAVGRPIVNRSHFDAMQIVELGTGGTLGQTTGWLARHLATASNLPATMVMPSLAVGGLQPASLAGNLETLALDDPQSFALDNGPWRWQPAQRLALRNMYEADSTWLHGAGVSALDALDIVELNVSGPYVPSNGAVYPDSDLGRQLAILARMIKLDLGLQVATVDIGGWDTHEGQGGSNGYWADLMADVSASLAAFWADLDGIGATAYTGRLTVVVQSEFGREVRENSDQGTEHGHGNLMMVLSGSAIGGLHGTWPGLHPDQLVDGTDLAVTTDYRRVLTEILIRRMCNPNIGQIFPGYSGYSPLGIVTGPDLPITGPPIFADGFESGSTNAWSSG